jgi:hypothetical protein
MHESVWKLKSISRITRLHFYGLVTYHEEFAITCNPQRRNMDRRYIQCNSYYLSYGIFRWILETSQRESHHYMVIWFHSDFGQTRTTITGLLHEKIQAFYERQWPWDGVRKSVRISHGKVIDARQLWRHWRHSQMSTVMLWRNKQPPELHSVLFSDKDHIY